MFLALIIFQTCNRNNSKFPATTINQKPNSIKATREKNTNNMLLVHKHNGLIKVRKTLSPYQALPDNL